MNEKLKSAVSEMRKAQKEYFKTKSWQALEESKRLEKEVDKLLAEDRQPTLFGDGNPVDTNGYDIRPLSHSQCLEKLRQITEDKDGNYGCEDSHFDADIAILGLLLELGFGDIVQLWCSFDKWFA